MPTTTIRRTPLITYAIASTPISACAAFSDDLRCSALVLTPSAVMTLGSRIPMKAKHALQVTQRVLETLGGGARSVKAAPRQRYDDAFAANQAFGSLFRVTEGFAWDRDTIDPRLKLAGTLKLYCATPRTTVSAAKNSPRTSVPSARSAFSAASWPASRPARTTLT
jgi:hypothetical protein